MTPVVCPRPPRPIPPALSTSLLLSFTKQPEIKPIPRAFFLFYLYFLKHLMLWLVWVGACVRRWQMCPVCQWALKSCVHMYILCESIRDLYFPLSCHSSRGKVETTVSVCTVILTEKAGFGRMWEIAGMINLAANPCQQVVCVLMEGGSILFSLSSVL